MKDGIYKSAHITVDVGDYQNIKLCSSFDIKFPPDSNTTDEEQQHLENKIWIDRGKDLKYALLTCLRKIGKVEFDPKVDVPIEIKKENRISAVVRKSCEIIIKISQGQNIKLSSGGEWTIEYGSDDEREVTERGQWLEIADDIVVSTTLVLDSLGKKTDAPDKFSKACRDKIVSKTKEKEAKNEKKV